MNYAIKLREFPQADARYVVAVVAEEGVSVVRVFMVATVPECVARWDGLTAEAAQTAVNCARLFNNGLLVCEYSKDGIAVGNQVMDLEYDNVYKTRPGGKATYVHHLTTVKNKDFIVERFYALCSEGMQCDEDDVIPGTRAELAVHIGATVAAAELQGVAA